eukprot:366549-Chlamydomonas_euryale.AAC.8
MAWYRREGPLRGRPDAPVAAVLLYRKHVVTEQPYIEQLVRQMEGEGVVPVPIFINGVEAHTVVRDLLTTQHEQVRGVRKATGRGRGLGRDRGGDCDLIRRCWCAGQPGEGHHRRHQPDAANARRCDRGRGHLHNRLPAGAAGRQKNGIFGVCGQGCGGSGAGIGWEGLRDWGWCGDSATDSATAATAISTVVFLPVRPAGGCLGPGGLLAGLGPCQAALVVLSLRLGATCWVSGSGFRVLGAGLWGCADCGVCGLGLEPGGPREGWGLGCSPGRVGVWAVAQGVVGLGWSPGLVVGWGCSPGRVGVWAVAQGPREGWGLGCSPGGLWVWAGAEGGGRPNEVAGQVVSVIADVSLNWALRLRDRGLGFETGAWGSRSGLGARDRG